MDSFGGCEETGGDEAQSRSSRGGKGLSSTHERVGGLEVAEIRLVLGEDPKAEVVPWGCGSRARTAALGIAYRSVGLPGKATWKKGEE